MWKVDPKYPLPIKFPNYVVGGFDTKIEAIKEIMRLQESRIHYLRVWQTNSYSILPGTIGIYYDDNCELRNSNSRRRITSENIFNTEREALQFCIDNPDPVFQDRVDELCKQS